MFATWFSGQHAEKEEAPSWDRTKKTYELENPLFPHINLSRSVRAVLVHAMAVWFDEIRFWQKPEEVTKQVEAANPRTAPFADPSNQGRLVVEFFRRLESYSNFAAVAERMEFLPLDVCAALETPGDMENTQFIQMCEEKELKTGLKKVPDVKGIINELEPPMRKHIASAIMNQYYDVAIKPKLAQAREEDRRDVVSGGSESASSKVTFAQKDFARQIKALGKPHMLTKIIGEARESTESSRTSFFVDEQERVHTQALSVFFTALGEYFEETAVNKKLSVNILKGMINLGDTKNTDEDFTIGSEVGRHFYMSKPEASRALATLNKRGNNFLLEKAKRELADLAETQQGFFGVPIFVGDNIRLTMTQYIGELEERKKGGWVYNAPEEEVKTANLVIEFCKELLAGESWLAHEIGDMIDDLDQDLPKRKTFLSKMGIERFPVYRSGYGFKGVLWSGWEAHELAKQEYYIDSLNSFINNVRMYFLHQIYFQASPVRFAQPFLYGLSEGSSAMPPELREALRERMFNALNELEADFNKKNPGVEYRPTVKELRKKVAKDEYETPYMSLSIIEWERERDFKKIYHTLKQKTGLAPSADELAKAINQDRWLKYKITDPVIVRVAEHEKPRPENHTPKIAAPSSKKLAYNFRIENDGDDDASVKDIPVLTEGEYDANIRIGPKMHLTDPSLRKTIEDGLDRHKMDADSDERVTPRYNPRKVEEHHQQPFHGLAGAKGVKYDFYKQTSDNDKKGMLTFNEVYLFSTLCCIGYCLHQRDGFGIKTSRTAEDGKNVRQHVLHNLTRLSGLYGRKEKNKAVEEQKSQAAFLRNSAKGSS